MLRNVSRIVSLEEDIISTMKGTNEVANASPTVHVPSLPESNLKSIILQVPGSKC